jgi:hypothetical protein
VEKCWRRPERKKKTPDFSGVFWRSGRVSNASLVEKLLNPLAPLRAHDDVNRGGMRAPVQAHSVAFEPPRLPGVRGVRPLVEKALARLSAGDVNGTREALEDLLADLGDAAAANRTAQALLVAPDLGLE